jgi:hypothetical protein
MRRMLSACATCIQSPATFQALPTVRRIKTAKDTGHNGGIPPTQTELGPPPLPSGNFPVLRTAESSSNCLHVPLQWHVPVVGASKYCKSSMVCEVQHAGCGFVVCTCVDLVVLHFVACIATWCACCGMQHVLQHATC